MRDFDVPSYDGDAETAEGIPKGAEEPTRRLVESDAFIVSSPEYNGSMPGMFKNLIDWTSRFRPQPSDGKRAINGGRRPPPFHPTGESTMAGAAVDRDASERWEDEGGRALAIEQPLSAHPGELLDSDVQPVDILGPQSPAQERQP